MNFETISRFHFDPIPQAKNAIAEMVSVSKNRVDLTTALWERMGKPQFISFAYDKEEKALGVKVTDESDPNKLEVIRRGMATPTCLRSKYISVYLSEMLNEKKKKKRIHFTHGSKVGDYYVFESRYVDINAVKKVNRGD